MIRRCDLNELDVVYDIVNDAAEAYRGAIPADRWHEPYMGREELAREAAAGVVFWGYEQQGALCAVMGLQEVRDVILIRHAYVRTARRNQGIGGHLLKYLRRQAELPMLVGTWAAAAWAVRFYQRHGFALVSTEEKERLLRTYWAIPERQVETSVVLADEAWLRRRQKEAERTRAS